VLATLIVETLINQNADYLVAQNTSTLGIALFILIAAIGVFGQYFILEYVKVKSREIRRKVRRIDIMHNIVTIIQYFLIALFIFVTIEIIVSQQYLTITLPLVTAASYGLNIGLMGIFAHIFFSWYKSNKNSIAVLLYGLSFAVVVITSSVFLAGSLLRFIEKPSYIYPDSEVKFASSEIGSTLYNLGKIYHYSDIVSFSLRWVSTTFLLYHYSKKMGKTKYWILVSIPLIYFLGTFMDDFDLYKPNSDEEWFYWYFYASLNSTAGGILFGAAFMLGAKHFPDKSSIKDYMIISGFGFILFSSAGQSTLTISPYPPFGFSTMSFYGLSSFLILLGLYSTASSVSQDNQLRRSIKKIATRDVNLLGSIGTAQMEQEIQRTVNSMKGLVEEQEKEMEEQSGIEANLEEDEMKKYLEEVMQEVGKAQRPSA
jgi:hypothetical protein